MTDPAMRNWTHEFPILDRLAFFNHAGVAPICARAAQALQRYAEQAATQAYVGSGWYRRAAEVKKLAAGFIGARGPEEIAFIPNTSTGLSLVAKGLTWKPGDQVVITNVEYPANRYPWQDLARFGVELVEVSQQPDGRIDLEDILEAVTDRTRVVSLSHVQYASGYRTLLRPVADMVHRVGGYLCVDAIQSLGAIPMDVQAHGIDFLAADGHKWLLAPEGCGIFYARRELIPLLHPNIVGWMNMIDAHNYGSYRFEFAPDARRFEPGSWNVPGILALGASLELLTEVGMDNVWQRIERLTDQLVAGLESRGYRVFSPRKPEEKSGIVSFLPPPPPPPPERGAKVATNTVPATDLTQLTARLEQQGIVIVIRHGRLRASPHFYNTPDQIDRLLEALPG